MNKYIKPTIEISFVEVADVIAASGGVTVTALEGVDTGDSMSAVFNANFWMY
ncbi:MAG: hypothetical protein IJ039_06470 [Clostridia bacterium]|nr:hypothetical protein [Clostridia bacterium]